MNNSLVLIVGGGPTGLVLALWLTRLGIPVRIIDKTAEPGTTSRALAVQARTLELYHQIGLADAVIAGGVKIANLNFWVHGARAARIPLQRIGEGLSPYRFALVFLRTLASAADRTLDAAGVGWAAHRTSASRNRATVCWQRFGCRTAPRKLRGSLHRGCDGAASTVQEQLAIGFPGGTYTGGFYVADVEAAGPVTDEELHVDLEEADFVLVFPLQGNGRLRLVGNVSDITGRDHGTLTFDDVRGKAIEHLKLTIQKVNWFSTYRVHHRVANHFRGGRAFLLGDAAHIHSPVGGQGMNTGIGDAVNLAWKLAANSEKLSRSLLDITSGGSFARRLVDTTDRAFTLVTRRGSLARVMRTRLVPRLAPLFRLPPIRRFMFKTLAQIGVNYRHSRLTPALRGQSTVATGSLGRVGGRTR
jgi:2-polyprenyl-6-methoxyphenol hydroxylase-like FAD-dependent oxidoreductase